MFRIAIGDLVVTKHGVEIFNYAFCGLTWSWYLCDKCYIKMCSPFLELQSITYQSSPQASYWRDSLADLFYLYSVSSSSNLYREIGYCKVSFPAQCFGEIGDTIITNGRGNVSVKLRPQVIHEWICGNGGTTYTEEKPKNS
jgi:hypothetical protein